METSVVIYIVPIQLIRIAKIENLTVIGTGMIVTREDFFETTNQSGIVSCFLLNVPSVCPEPVQFKVTHGNLSSAVINGTVGLLTIVIVYPRKEHDLPAVDYLFG